MSIETENQRENPVVVPTVFEVEVGIVTRGKPTLGMVLASLLLQESVKVRIHVVDTSDHPIISRDDVRFALRLATDRKIHCTYDYAGPSDRAFSAGKARLLRTLQGPHLCLMDDDVVMPSVALSHLVETAQTSGIYGYISPFCKNSPDHGNWGNRPQCTPGSLIYQDELVHRVLLQYYDTTVDLLDRKRSSEKVWETAFLTALFEQLERPGIRQSDTITYHLDYQEDANWIDEERTVIARSALVARDLVQAVKRNGSLPGRAATSLNQSTRSARRLVARARHALHLGP